MRLAISHTTRYTFSSPVAHGLQRLRLTPLACRGQATEFWEIELEGAQPEVSYDDENGNRVTLISFVPGTREVVIRSQGVVETSDHAGVMGKQLGQLPLWHFTEQTALTRGGPRLPWPWRTVRRSCGDRRSRSGTRSIGRVVCICWRGPTA